MSVYHSPNHNRLLDLEYYLRNQQSKGTTLRKDPEWQSIQRTQSPPRLKKQAENQSHAFNYQHRATADVPPLPRQARRTQPQPNVNSNSTTRRPVRQKTGSMHHDESSGSYQQLASQMGKHHSPHKSVARKQNNDLPDISTPISQEVVENFATKTAAKRKQQPITPPTSVSTRSSPQPKWNELATSIRQSRLGISGSDLESDKLDSSQSSAQVELTSSTFDKPSTEQAQDRVAVKMIFDEMSSAEKNQQEPNFPADKTSTAPVTIDVTPVTITSIETNRVMPSTVMYPQELDMAIAVQVKKSTLETVAEVEDLPSNNNPDDAQKIEHPIPVAETINLKDRALRFYQSSRPYVVECLTQFQRKIHDFKETHD